MIGFVFFTKFLDTLQMSPRLSASHIVENMDIDSQFLRHPYDLFAFGKFLTGALYRSLVDSSARIVAAVYILVQTIISRLSHVLLVSDQLKVLRAVIDLVIVLVMNLIPFRDRAKEVNVNKPMGANRIERFVLHPTNNSIFAVFVYRASQIGLAISPSMPTLTDFESPNRPIGSDLNHALLDKFQRGLKRFIHDGFPYALYHIRCVTRGQYA